jgi:hypothetical protein
VSWPFAFFIKPKTKKPPDCSSGFSIAPKQSLDFFDGFEHLENRLAGADEKTFVVFAEATALKRVAAIAFAFSSHDLLRGQFR